MFFCYNRGMNPIQQKLLDLARSRDLGEMRRVDIQSLIGCEYPSQITHHLNQLIKRGDLVRKDGRLIPSIRTGQGFFTVPVMGEADCGEATKYADGRIWDNLVISPSLLKSKHPERVFALIARGDSMNRAVIDGNRIENDDFILVEKADGYMPEQDDIVVSNIGGLANVKRFRREPGRVVLMPDSYRADYYPIFIDESDDYSIEGKVIGVVKSAK